MPFEGSSRCAIGPNCGRRARLVMRRTKNGRGRPGVARKVGVYQTPIAYTFDRTIANTYCFSRMWLITQLRPAGPPVRRHPTCVPPARVEWPSTSEYPLVVQSGQLHQLSPVSKPNCTSVRAFGRVRSGVCARVRACECARARVPVAFTCVHVHVTACVLACMRARHNGGCACQVTRLARSASASLRARLSARS